VGDDLAGALAELRHHYGSAYLIEHPDPDVWIARRRDNREVLRAEDPEILLRLIRADYAANPVSRSAGPPPVGHDDHPPQRLRPGL
jgi:hypothetical protein